MSGVYVHNQKTFNSNQGLAGWKFDLDKTGTIPITSPTEGAEVNAIQFDFSGHILVDASTAFKLKLSATSFNDAVSASNSTVSVPTGKFIFYVENGTYAGTDGTGTAPNLTGVDYIKVDTV